MTAPIRALAVALAILLSGCTRLPEAPLLATGPVLAPAVEELRAFADLPEAQQAAFRPARATPERLQQLLAAPDIAQLPPQVRKAAVRLAAPLDTILVAERPSEVVQRMRRWFPEDTVADTRRGELRAQARALPRPDAGWSPRSLVFAALWQCLPQRVWVWADGMPPDGQMQLASWPLSATSSAPEESEFGQCVRVRLADRPAFDERQQRDRDALRAAVAARAVPALDAAFERMLAGGHCEARGADDCVTLAAAWASLSPAAPALARAMQRLDADVAPGTPLPAARRVFTDTLSSTVEDARERFQAGLRRAQWLRARLHSIAHAPDAWPADALPTTIAQMSRLREDFLDPFVQRWYQFDIDYRNEADNPWRGFDALPGQPRLRAAVLAEIARVDADAQRPCATLDWWFKRLAPSLQTRHALAVLATGREPRCTAPEWDWMQARPSDPDVPPLRDALARTVAGLQGTAYDNLVTGFTGGGEGCFGPAAARDAALAAVCDAAVSEPQAVRTRLPHARLALTRTERFQPVRPPAAAASPDTDPDDPPRTLRATVDALRPGLGDAVQGVLDTLATLRLAIDGVSGWRSPHGDDAVVAIGLFPGESRVERPWPWSGDRVLLRVTASGLQPIGIPSRFGFQYDSGAVTAVSDLDRDGHLEVWITGTFGECDGEDSKPGVDCAVEVVHMGEIRGDALSWFVRGAGPGAPSR